MQIIGLLLILLVPFILIFQNTETLRREKLILDRLDRLENKIDKINNMVDDVDYEVNE